MTEHLLVLTTLPDRDTAQRLGKQIVRAKLAACVTLLHAAQSIYLWHDEECIEDECLMLIKTTESCYAKLESHIQSQHPYELAEIIATPITKGLDDYLHWITKSIDA